MTISQFNDTATNKITIHEHDVAEFHLMDMFLQ
jgi:hypothetical protein